MFLPLHLKISLKEADITDVFLNGEHKDQGRNEINEKSPHDQSRTELYLFPSHYLATYLTKAGGELSNICISQNVEACRFACPEVSFKNTLHPGNLEYTELCCVKVHLLPLSKLTLEKLSLSRTTDCRANRLPVYSLTC